MNGSNEYAEEMEKLRLENDTFREALTTLVNTVYFFLSKITCCQEDELSIIATLSSERENNFLKRVRELEKKHGKVVCRSLS